MLLILALLVGGVGKAADSTPLAIDRRVIVESADFKSLKFQLKSRPGTVDVMYSAARPDARVRLILIPLADESRFRSGRSHQRIAATEFDREGRIRVHLNAPGDYAIIVDNRHESNRRATVHLRGTLSYDDPAVVARTLTSARRAIVVGSSLACFFGIVWFAGRRLWRIF